MRKVHRELENAMLVISQQLLHKSWYSTMHRTLQKPRTSQIKNKALETMKQKNTINQFCKFINLRGTSHIVKHNLLPKFVRAWKWRKQKLASENITKMTMTKKQKTFYVTKYLQAITSCVNHHHAKIQFLTFQTLKWP